MAQNAIALFLSIISIKTYICKHCTNFTRKALTNTPKCGIIIAQKETLVCFNTGRGNNYDLRILQGKYDTSKNYTSGN